MNLNENFQNLPNMSFYDKMTYLVSFENFVLQTS